MKKVKLIGAVALFTLIAFSACQRNAKELNELKNETVLGKPPAPPVVCNPNAYNVVLESKTLSGSNWTWIWSVQNPNPGNGNGGTSQDLSHWGMQFGTCLIWSDIVGAAYSTNGGSTWNSFTPTYQVDPSQSCLTTPVLKFDVGTSGTNKTYYKLILNKNYSVNPAAFAYYKSGSRMPCCTFTFQGVGCPEGQTGKATIR